MSGVVALSGNFNLAGVTQGVVSWSGGFTPIVIAGDTWTASADMSGESDGPFTFTVVAQNSGGSPLDDDSVNVTLNNP